VLWKSYGGNLYPPELLSVTAGHLLNAGLTIALAAATASVTEHPSTAAILTLSVTVGTWILNFVAAVQGGIWERAAGYTPTAMVAEFQHGLVRLDAVLVACALILAGLGLAAVWIRLGVAVSRRAFESIAIGVLGFAVIALAARATASWDFSENRANSFSEADQEALSHVTGRLRIEAHLAAEDPRRVDLERQSLSKLRRLMPSVEVDYVSSTSTGLFEQTAEHYGEIWYELDGRRIMSRTTSAEGVLESIYAVGGITRPAESESAVFRGHPLPAAPRHAAVTFYAAWPALVLALAFVARRRNR
jgi:ABC-2 type transport system permease protein